ncbi:hypothetical protein RRG08_038714 [Elysia crispata]|uniref:Uncharacterized protein n=1 Tax=Elysia crispata TaxID=231223 RepID=A0AAE1DI06_9GAST|nr:hypothetical protein RRG08_038714 [Elysia crispata]
MVHSFGGYLAPLTQSIHGNEDGIWGDQDRKERSRIVSYVPLFVQLEGKRGPAVRLKTGRGGKNATSKILFSGSLAGQGKFDCVMDIVYMAYSVCCLIRPDVCPLDVGRRLRLPNIDQGPALVDMPRPGLRSGKLEDA